MAQQVVLLVDDDDDVRDTIGDLLEADQFRVLRASDAAQALMMMRDEAIDMLVTDLAMPGADGVTLIQQARKIMPDLPAILLTGYAEQVSSVAMSAGGFHVLRKPVTADYLTGQIRSLLERPIEPGK
jgi:DNA-binding NtrC family response regulator